MPTGYTSTIKDDTTFAEFAMTCARAFGALVTMREADQDAEIPEEFAVDAYYSEQHKVALARLSELETMTAAQKDAAADRAFGLSMKDWRASKAESDALRARYQRMLDMAREWKPPTKDHVGLADFIVEQIESSIKFDCHESPAPSRQTGKQWHDKQLASAKWDLEYSAKHYAEEVARVKSRNKWIRDLRNSLKETR
jgi:hypothetical protein